MVRPSMSHDASPDAFGEASMRCRGYPPDCSYHGECLHDGDCFRSEKRCVVEARRAILTAADAIESADVAQMVRDAARLLVERHNREVRDIAKDDLIPNPPAPKTPA